MSQSKHPRAAWLLPAVLCSTLPSMAFGQSATDDTAATSEESTSPLVVTATRSRSEAGQTPQKITVISREQIEQQLAITSDRGQILNALIPGYSPSRQKLTNSGETFRGRSPLFMVDGIPQSNPLRDGARDSYTIDLAMVERIEVIHGASAEHGLGATGGIINFVTIDAEPGEVNQHVSASISSGDDFESEGIGHKLGYHINGQRGNLDYLAAVTRQEHGVFFDGEGRRIGVDGTQGEIQDSSSYDIFTKLGYWLDDNQNIGFSFNRFELKGDGDYVAVPGDRDASIPTTSRRGTVEGDPPYNESTTVGLTYSHADWFGNELDAKLYHQSFRGQFGGGTYSSFQDPSIAPDGTLFDQSRSESDKYGAKLTLNRDGLLDDRLALTTGLDLQQDETQQLLSQTDREWVPPTQFRNAAAFLQGEFSLTDALSVHSGVRQEYAELDVDTYRTIASNNGGVTVEGGKPSFDETLYNLGAVYQANDWAQVFANYSEGFGMPDVRNLRDIDEPGQDVDTLLELQPIVTENREIGTRLNWERLSVELSYFESDADYGQRMVTKGGTIAASREKTEISGVELSSEIRVTDQHRVDLSYSHVEGKTDTDDDGRVDTKLDGMNIPPDTLRVGWGATWNEHLSSHLQVSHYFDRSFDDPELEFDGYTLLDASLGYRLPVGELSFGIENLTDEQYITYYSQTAPWANNDNSHFAGRGRTFTLGYQLDF
ncbi:TonB-dependent receptor [Vreelandella aquamarina]|uniref:TonB-dependent receptor n=1 Tax=Vreelandella aquamarina TaxID=77097 RepID=UPI00384B7EBA